MHITDNLYTSMLLLLLLYFGPINCDRRRRQWSLFRMSRGKGVFSTPLGVPDVQSHVLPYPYSRKIDFNESNAGKTDVGAAKSSRNSALDLSADNMFADERNVYAVVREDIFNGTPDLYVSRKPSCQPLAGQPREDQVLHFRPMYSNIALVSRSNSDLMPAKCRWKCGWGPFNVAHAHASRTSADGLDHLPSPDQGRMYFVVAGMFGGGQHLRHEVHLRRMRSECRHELNAKSRRGSEPRDFDVLNCSELISVVSKGRAAKTPSRSKAVTWSGSSLVIVPGNSKHFIFQQYNTMTGLASLVRVDEATGITDVLHSKPMPRYILKSKYKIKAIGSVAYQRGTLCWTMASELFCEDYAHTFPTPLAHRTQATDKQTTPRESSTHATPATDRRQPTRPDLKSRITGEQVASVCKGTIRDELKKVLTGVAIHNTRSNPAKVQVYFGCYSEIAGNGGMGVLSMWLLKSSVKSVRSVTNSQLYAGAVMVDETTCAAPATTPATTTPTTTTTATTSTTTTSTATPPTAAKVESTASAVESGEQEKSRPAAPSTTPATSTVRIGRKPATAVYISDTKASGAPRTGRSPSATLMLSILVAVFSAKALGIFR